MAEVNRCPQCNCDMPPDSPAGLCPACLLGAGLGPSDALAANSLATEAKPAAGFVPPKPQDLAGHFPQFEILDLLGYGGMGAVYKARQKSLDRLVALKIIKPDAAGDPGFAERFDREARALAKLSHSNIVSVYDSGEENGLYYFLMEYVDGTNLRRLIESKELSPEQAISIIPQICEALQYAHDEEIVHRDIKPENILVDSRGRVKIADFGLAKLLGNTSINDHTLTGTHQVMGTPRYMAPEQMEGSKTVDHRADIYSLGVVFYEMLTGELPMGSFEPPSQKAPVDGRLDQVVLRSLAKEPERRYQHASEVRTDIEAIQSPIAPPAYAAPASYRPGAVGSQPVRFSRKAIIGACGIPLFFIGSAAVLAPAVILDVRHGDVAPAWPWWRYAILVMVAVFGIAGLAAPFGTTICGFLAMNDIRHSQGRLRGLGLAFFDALFFPLLIADILLGICVFQLAQALLPPPEFTIQLFAPVLLVILLTNIPFIIWSWRRVSDDGLGSKQSDLDNPPTDWSPLVFGSLLVIPLVAVMAFGMYMTGSAWVLAALALPWICLGIAGVSTDGTPKEKAVTWLAVMCFLLSLGLIVQGIVIEQSAWPLAGLAVGLVGMFMGMLLQEMGSDKTNDPSGDAIAQAADQITAVNGQLAKMVEENDDDEDEEDSPEENLQWAAWWIGVVGALRCWSLVSDFPSALDKLSRGEAMNSPGELVISMTGPVVLVGAIAMYHARSFVLSIVACVLCMASGSCLPVILGIWALFVLFDSDVQRLFVSETDEQGPPNGTKPAKPAVPYGYGAAIGSTIGEVWTHWWRERDSLFTRVVQTFLLLLHVACLLAFLSFSSRGGPDSAGHPRFKHDVGFPSPWLTIETTGGAGASFSHEFHWSSPAWLVAAFAFSLCYVYCRIERVRNTEAGYWYRPEAFLLLWGVLALGSFGLGVGMGQLAMRGKAPNPASQDETSSELAVADRVTSQVQEKIDERTDENTEHVRLTPLMEAVLQGDIARVKELLETDIDPNERDANGETALMKAAARGHEELIDALSKADFEARDKLGKTAVFHAIEQRRVDYLTARIEKAQEFLAGWSPLANQYDRLINAETLSVRDGSGRTPLQFAEELQLTEVAARLRKYLQAVVDADTRRIAGEVPMVSSHYKERAHAHRALDLVDQADIDQREAARLAGVRDGARVRSAAIHEACRFGDTSRVKELLDENASVNEKDVAGRTLLMKAIASGNRSLALTLIVLGADLTEQDERGRTALMYAVEARDSVFIARLRELQKIAYAKDTDKRKAELRAFSGVERTLLDGRDFDLRNLEYADLELQTDNDGETASLIAARLGDWDVFSIVASHVDSFRARNKRGQTIAIHAATHGRRQWFELLTDPKYFGVAGETDVYVGEMVPFDVEQLALTDNDGQTALQHAEAQGHTEITDILRRHLQTIIENQTAEIEKGRGTASEHYKLRALAWQALGEPEKAKPDFANTEDEID